MDAHWMNLADSDLTRLPPETKLISNNGVSVVYRYEGYIYKRSIPFLIENELYCLNIMQSSGFVPRGVFRYDKYTIAMHYIEPQVVTDPRAFMAQKIHVYNALRDANIRHGDLTEKAVIVNNNWPFLIDFAESRLMNDPRPDKRKEGDWYWLNETFDKLCMKLRSAHA